MTAFPFDARTRVATRATIADLSAPTLAELATSTDVTCDITPSGLAISHSTGETDRTFWTGRQTASAPTRWSTSVVLSGFRRSEDGVLYPSCVFGARVVLIVRYGLAYEDDWAAGQSVEVIRGRWGKRQTARSGRNSPVTFDAPLIVASDVDDATVVD